MRGRPALVLLLALLPRAGATEREMRTQMEWVGQLPTPEELKREQPEPLEGERRRRPLLIYTPHPLRSADQDRFEAVVTKNESFVPMSRFFECVEVAEKTAKGHALFEGIRFKPPAVLVFDSTRKRHAVAKGRASAMKATGIMRKIEQPDYIQSMKETVRKAKVLEKDIAKDERKLTRLHDKTEKQWRELWDLKTKKRGGS